MARSLAAEADAKFHFHPYTQPRDLEKNGALVVVGGRGVHVTDEHGKEAVPHLQEAIKQCKRVAEMGDKVDPGASLNPATKARAAAREAMKHLNSLRDGGA